MAAENRARQRLFLKIYTRKGVLIDEEVKSVSSVNDTGVFDVLQEHAQFISKIRDRLTVTKLDDTELVYPVGDAIMRVKGEMVEVFLGIKTA